MREVEENWRFRMDEPACCDLHRAIFRRTKSMDETDIKTQARDLSVLLENYRDPDVDKEEIKILLMNEIAKLATSLLERRTNCVCHKTRSIEITNFLCFSETVKFQWVDNPKDYDELTPMKIGFCKRNG